MKRALLAALALLWAGIGTAAAQDPIWTLFPTTPFTCNSLVEGYSYMDTTLHIPYVCNGTSWNPVFATLTGSGTSNTVTKWTGSSTLGNSAITDDGTTITANSNTTITSSLLTAPNILDSGLSASRIVLSDASKNLVSNGAITTNAIPKSASSGASLSASSLSDDGTVVTGTLPLQLGNGLITAPTYSFSGSTNTGMWRSGSNLLDFAVNGVQVMQFRNDFVYLGDWQATGAAATNSEYDAVNATGTDTAGQNLFINAGRSTGTGVGGNMSLRITPPAASTGSTLNTRQAFLLAAGNSGAVTVGGVNAVSPGSSSFSSANRATGQTDGTGVSTTINGGRGTGTGEGGSVILAVPPKAATTGSTQNALSNIAVFAATGGITLGGINSQAPGASTWSSGNAASGLSNTAGGNMTIGTGLGTGSGTAATLALQVAPNAGTGTTQNTAKTALSLTGTSFTLGNVTTNSGGAATAASLVQGYNGAGTDSAGGALTVAGGAGTGTGAAGVFKIQMAPPASTTGSSANSQVDLETWGVNSTADPQLRTATFGGPNGGTLVRGVATELLTLATGATTTDTTNNLLPAGAIIEAVTTRVTTTITTCATFSVGDPTTAARFSASAGGVAANSTRIGLQHMQGSVTTDAAGPVQATADKVRITCNANPGAGVIRIQVWYRQFVAPTS